jgi:hypothetical protein
MRPSFTSRILLTAGTVRLLRKLRATISRSDENSNEVKSDFLGISCMAFPFVGSSAIATAASLTAISGLDSMLPNPNEI